MSLLLGLIRTSFFILASLSWDSTSGKVANNKLLFYVLDEGSTILYFSLSSVLLLFWAEIYYISIDDEATYHHILKPVICLLNFAAYMAVAICTFLLIGDYTDETDYVFTQYSIQIAVVYLITSIIFGFYAHHTAKELSTIPVQVSTRKERTIVLRNISYIFIGSLTIRAIVLLIISNTSINTSSLWGMSLVLLYYISLEFIPAVKAVSFHRVHNFDDEYLWEESSKPWETIPITGESDHHGSGYNDVERLVERLSQR